MTIRIGGSHSPQHAPQPWFECRDDQLVLAHKTIIEIAAQAGCTPFYAYDHGVIDKKIAQLRALLPPQIQLHYAIKANPMPAVVHHISQFVQGVDVASTGELEIALRAGMPANNISFAGPGKTDAELETAVNAGITLNVESARELAVLATIAQTTGRTPRINIRVNPNFELKTSGMKMGGGAKPFGIDAEQVPDILRSLRQMPLEFRGFHIFSGAQNLRAEAIVEAQSLAYELSVALAVDAPRPILEINLGGGFGIPYFPGDQPLDLEPIASNLKSLLSRAQTQFPQAKLILELGRYLVGECGVYVCKVIDRKISRGQTFLITDGGMHHHLAASGNFGQVIRKNYPVVVGNRLHEGEREIVTVVGPLCTPLDVLADRMEMGRAEIGDLMVIMQSGAYGLTASPLRFLSHPAPVELFL